MTVDLAELRALWEAATPGPWEFTDGFTLWAADGTILSTDLSDADAALIVAMHAALPGLIAAAEATPEVQYVEELSVDTIRAHGEALDRVEQLEETLRDLLSAMRHTPVVQAKGGGWRLSRTSYWRKRILALGVPGSLVEPTPEET